MNLIANTGIQFFTVPLEINLNDNFKMFFHEWFDNEEELLKLEIAHFFSEDEVWVKKSDLSELGYSMNGRVTDTWDEIKEDFYTDGKEIISIETDDAKDSGCFQASISRIKWEKFENVWLPVPFFLLNGNKSEFGPTNWTRCKLIPVGTTGNSKKYNLLLAFDTRSLFESEDFEDEDLNETPVFTSDYDKSKDYALCNNEYKLAAYCSEAFNCGWVDKYLLKHFHNILKSASKLFCELQNNSGRYLNRN